MKFICPGFFQQAALVFMSVPILLGSGCVSAPESFTPANPLPASAYSADTFNEVLKAHVSEGQVDYPAIAQDTRFLDYLAIIDRVDPASLPPERRLPFWINVYNAHAIAGVIGGATPETWGGKYRFFLSDKHAVGGQRINLYSLEHGIILPLSEPRVHFALVCAAQSCPPLRSEAYRGGDLNAQLNAQARTFINNPQKNRFDIDTRTAYLSKIFDWFADDFATENGPPLLHYVANYVDNPALAKRLKTEDWRIEYLDYDWATNGTTTLATP